MHVIIDYDVGNLDSVQRAFKRVGIDTIISGDKEVIKDAKSLILPGVGAFGDAMEKLKERDLIKSIKRHVNCGKFLIGICLGMQLLYEKGYEYGEYQGLDLIKGSVKILDISLKVPHMGWNQLNFIKKDPVLRYIKENDYVYFVHSYYVNSSQNELIAYADYEKKIPAIVRKKNIYGMQFHPEKSGDVGEKILKAYGEMIK
ncbi:imidazole glycerol phosphate synthase subunit HisH [Haloimpatiens sp. FM7330]|uniref:imidazole glycerol phosphate synthase subunit HisH n=1 Tax=Haloimpatiens sp. FM7330 TaxID=3298610 RepID=UPI003638E807